MPWNSCLQDVSSIMVNTYSIYVYIYRNIVTSEPAYAIFATSYGIQLIGKISYIRCGENEVTLEDALLLKDPSLQPGALTVEEQINQINQHANFTDLLQDQNTTETTEAATKNNEEENKDPWKDPWAFLSQKV